MTAQILKSQIKDEGEFRDALEKLRQAKIDHMLNGEIGTAPPSDPFLDQFIVRRPTGPDTPDEIFTWVQIVNDDPPPPEPPSPLEALRAEEVAEIEKIFPSSVRRIAQMTANRALMVPEDKRNSEEQSVVDHWTKLQKQIEEIQFAYAQREAEL